MKTFLRVALTRRALLSALLSAAVLSAPSSGNNALDIMFSSTQAQSGSTRNMEYFTGGSFEMRVPQKTFQLVAADPPRFDAGCNGISFHFGSFSFISLDAFKDMLRKIAQAAPGYFLHLAIQTMCTGCSNLLTWLQELMAKMNLGALNTCAISKTLVNTAFTSLIPRSAVESAGGSVGAYDRAAEDSISGTNGGDWFSNLGTQLTDLRDTFLRGPAGAQRTAQQKSGMGPSLFSGDLRNRGEVKSPWELYGVSETVGKRMAVVLLLSTIGEEVKPKVTAETDTRTTDAGTVVPTGSAQYLAGQMDLRLLEVGPAGGNVTLVTPVWSNECDTDRTDAVDCDVTTISWQQHLTLNPGSFAGTRAWAHNILFGTTDYTSSADPLPGSLLGRVRDGAINSNAGPQPLNANQLTDQQRKFLLIAPPGLAQLMMEAKVSAALLKRVGVTARDVVARQAALLMAEDIARRYKSATETSKTAARPTSGGASTVDKAAEGAAVSKEQAAAFEKFHKELLAARLVVLDPRMTALEAEAELVSRTRAMLLQTAFRQR